MTDQARFATLKTFVAWTGAHISGDEKGEAQIFLDRLFQAFGWPGLLDAGANCEKRIKNDSGGTAFADLVWKPIVLIEMKRRGTDLSRHYRQAFDYWTRLVPGRPRYVVLCNFDEFWVYDFETQMDVPIDTLALTDLPTRFGPLAFLSKEEATPVFGNHQETVTRQAADKLAECFNSLLARGVDHALSQRFVLQFLMALFAEDIGLLERYMVVRLLDQCARPRDAYDLLGGLFEAMNTPTGTKGGRYKGVAYFNGGLFQVPARIELQQTELAKLKDAAKFDWSKVRPEIFGALFEHSLGKEERHAFGAHFTSPADIMKIVGPTIVEPWRAAIEGAKSLRELGALLVRIETFKVLDPACGSGNFLYIAYRELKRLETRIYERMVQDYKSVNPTGRPFGFVLTRNFYGMDVNPFAVEIAKVTMMLAHKLAIDELRSTENALPLDNLDANIVVADALIQKNGTHTTWPTADVIIGNPPFLGAKLLKPARGADYVDAVRRAYPKVPGMADYCVYWFRRAQDHLRPCTIADPFSGRAGLVGTQNIRNNQSRVGGMDYIVENGTVVDAVDNQPWSGEANVSVSIVNWVKTKSPKLLPKKRHLWFKADPVPGGSRRARGAGSAVKIFDLNMREVPFINSALSDQQDVSIAAILSNNEGFCYTGQYPRHDGFMIDGATARQFIAASAANRQVVWPFLVGDEMLSGASADRWVIDFQTRSILEAQAFTLPFSHVERHVLPYITALAATEREKTEKKTGQDQNWLSSWWRHFRPRPELIGKISGIGRYLVCSRVTKRPIFAFVSSTIRPGDALSCFVLPDDYSFGILQSNAHWQWFVAKCSKLTERFRYTPESVFDTFPWPQSPSKRQVDAIAEAGRDIRRIRDAALARPNGSLRALYRTLELPGNNPLRDANAALDAAVLGAYGFSARDDLLSHLLGLNQTVSAAIEHLQTVTGPGIPRNYRNQAALVTTDCYSV